MLEARHDLGRARLFKPEALGTPGKRTFRFQIEAERGSANVWMEKAQLCALATAVKKFLEDNPARAASRDSVIETLPEPYLDFKAASLGLAYDETSGLFAILAYEAEDFERDTATLICWVTRRQIDQMADAALIVVNAGRPICPLCKQAMDPEGHVCVKSNGHKAASDEL